MKHLAALIFVGFIGLTLFGTFGMATSHEEHSENCIAATAKRIDCPERAGLLDFAAFHIGTFKEFSLAVFGENVISGFLLAFTYLLSFGLAVSSAFLSRSSEVALYRHRFQNSFSPSQQNKLTHWLAFHEHSPASLY